MNVLIIEDNEADQKILREAFKPFASDLRLSFAQDSEQAWSLLKEKRAPELAMDFRAIILDVNLPKKNGKEILKELKSDAQSQRIPVLMFSSSYTYEDMYECYSSGASCFLIKPMEFSELKTMARGIYNFWIKPRE